MELKCKSKMVCEREAYKKLCEHLEEENKQLEKRLMIAEDKVKGLMK